MAKKIKASGQMALGRLLADTGEVMDDKEKKELKMENMKKKVCCSQDYIDGSINTNVCRCDIKTFQITGWVLKVLSKREPGTLDKDVRLTQVHLSSGFSFGLSLKPCEPHLDTNSKRQL